MERDKQGIQFMENVQDAATPPINVAPPYGNAKMDELAVVSSSRRDLTQAAILVGALVMMFVGEYQIFRDPPDALTGGSPFLIAFGVILLLVVLGNGLRTQATAPAVIDEGYIEPVRIKPGWMAASVALAGFAAWRGILKPQQAYLGEYLLVWGMAMLTMILAVLPSEGQPYAKDKNPIGKREWALIGVLLLAALGLRVVNLGSVPYLMDQDEAKFANEGATLYQQVNFQATPFEPGVDSHPRIFMMMISVSVGLLGPTLFAARLPSAIMAALCIPALYLLGREIFGWRLALVASLFMLPWSYQILFARLSMNQPADPLFATLAFYFLLRGLRRGAVVDFVASGIFLGVAQMFYLGGRMAPVAMLGYLIFQFIRDRKVITRQWRALILVPIALLIITLPQNFYLLYFQEPFSTRADKSVLLNGELQHYLNLGGDTLRNYVEDQVRYSFGALISTGDRSGWYGRGSNLMGLLGSPLIILGIIASFLMLWKFPKWCIPIGWGFTIILVMSTLGISPPEYERFYPGTSAYSLLVALGVLMVALAITRVIHKPELVNRLVLALGVLLFIGNLAYLTLDYIPSRGYIRNRPNWVVNRIASQMVDETNAGRYVVMVGGGLSEVQNADVVKYFMSGKAYTYLDMPVDAGVETPGSGIDFSKPLTFVVAAQRGTDMSTLLALLPGGTSYEVHLDQDGSLVFFLYKVDHSPANLIPKQS